MGKEDERAFIKKQRILVSHEITSHGFLMRRYAGRPSKLTRLESAAKLSF